MNRSLNTRVSSAVRAGSLNSQSPNAVSSVSARCCSSSVSSSWNRGLGVFEFFLGLGHPDRLVVGDLLQQRQPVHAATGPAVSAGSPDGSVYWSPAISKSHEAVTGSTRR
ncbi:hypothetical protein FXW78_54035 [Rhodococcus opacus]|nr:hypothetical protein [Rhodococcus opacus]